MDTQLNYTEIVKRILCEYVQYFAGDDDGSLKVLFDDPHQRYLVLDIRWDKGRYIHHTPIHVDIINRKIWIQYDDTEEGIATDLLEAGVPNEDIVLGFHPTEVRPYTEFAIG